MKSTSGVIGLSVPFLLVLLCPAMPGHAGQTTRASIASTGEQANGGSNHPSISADGRYLAFESDASNLVAGDVNGSQDVFIRDLVAGTTTLVSVNSAGEQGDGRSYDASISADGRYVAFASEAANLVEGDGNEYPDVFVRDLLAGTTTRISVSSAGVEGNGWSIWPSISADGLSVAFESSAANLVAGDTNGAEDIFVHDLATGTTTRVSVDSSGNQGDSSSHWASISADGSTVAFDSGASNLAAGDTNGADDVFIHDLVTGITTRVSVDSAGTQGNGGSNSPSISADGRHVAFWSTASNIVAGDTNGTPDVFVRDLQTGSTALLSIDSTGVPGNGNSWYPAISADGRSVAFLSQAANLVPGDTNGFSDIFVHDRVTGQTTRSSVDSAGVQGTMDSYSPAISADGRYVAFFSLASNLVPGDSNDLGDIFVRDCLCKTTETADIEIVVSSDPVSVRKGTTASYAFTVTNNGPAAADNVTLIDVLSKGKAYRPHHGKGNCRVVVHRLDTLAAGASTTVTVAIEAKGKLLIQTLTASARQPDNVPDNNRVEISTPVTHGQP